MGLRIFCARQLCLKAFGTGPVPDTPWLPRPPEHPPPKRCVPPWPPGGLPVATLGSDFSLMLGICDLSGLWWPVIFAQGRACAVTLGSHLLTQLLSAWPLLCRLRLGPTGWEGLGILHQGCEPQWICAKARW